MIHSIKNLKLNGELKLKISMLQIPKKHVVF